LKTYKASKNIATTTSIVIDSLFKNICAETGGMFCFKAKLMVVDSTVSTDTSNALMYLMSGKEKHLQVPPKTFRLNGGITQRIYSLM